jgi:hypothetical protein
VEPRKGWRLLVRVFCLVAPRPRSARGNLARRLGRWICLHTCSLRSRFRLRAHLPWLRHRKVSRLSLVLSLTSSPLIACLATRQDIRLFFPLLHPLHATNTVPTTTDTGLGGSCRKKKRRAALQHRARLFPAPRSPPPLCFYSSASQSVAFSGTPRYRCVPTKPLVGLTLSINHFRFLSSEICETGVRSRHRQLHPPPLPTSSTHRRERRALPLYRQSISLRASTSHNDGRHTSA